jgi:hypothetical protein
MSDGTIECHAITFGEEDKDPVKTTQLSADELAKLTAVLNDPRLRDLSARYRLERMFIDSWMEWEITIEQPLHSSQNITLSFAGGSGDLSLPASLKRLDCEILELRRRVYGEVDAYYSPACTP